MTGWGLAAALVAAVIAGTAVWVRLAPADPVVWHRRPEALRGDSAALGGFTALRNTSDPDAALAAADRLIRATPRTSVIAGSLAERMLTYETRSALWGFPDYTTVWAGDRQIGFHGRLRFGRRDFGVNRARIEGWLAELGL